MKRQLAEIARQLAYSAAASVASRVVARPPAVALLFHRFFANSETHQSGIDRLRRELEWLRANYTPVSLSDFVAGLGRRSLPDKAVLITTDDAKKDLLHVADEFKAFEVPLCAFVCAGWTAAASAGTGEDLLARAASVVQWYEGDDATVHYGDRRMALSPAAKARNIETLISDRSVSRSDIEELCTSIEALGPGGNTCCTWQDLRRLTAAGVEIGAHSVTHVNLAAQSAVRRAFEIAESKRLCEHFAGSCQAFAYPFGMANTHNRGTRAELERVGFEAAFLTYSGFIAVDSDLLTLPRIAMPDEPMSYAEFRARAGGFGIVVRHLKERFGVG